MWSPVQTIGRVGDDDFANCGESPKSRNKHAMCTTADGQIYLMGGRSSNRPLKDLWRLDPDSNTWEEVKCWGDQPPNLQEHTMISWKDKLYIFGGEVGFSSSTETPFWILDLGTCIWRRGNSGPTRSQPRTVMHPSGRRAHSAVIYKDSMHIYGGYQDLRGSSSELWTFNLNSEHWHLVSCSSRCSGQPSPRHSHSAIVHDNCMWIYGGMTDLQEKGDFWKWNFESYQWSKVKCSKGPGYLHSHSAINAFGCMLIFGGVKDGQLSQDLWKFHFDSNTWEKINVIGLMPNPRCRHTAVANPNPAPAKSNGTKVRPKSEVLESIFTLESLLEQSEYDIPPSSSTGVENSVVMRCDLKKISNKRHTVSESMSYYSLCFPSPPLGRRIESPSETDPSDSMVVENNSQEPNYDNHQLSSMSIRHHHQQPQQPLGPSSSTRTYNLNQSKSSHFDDRIYKTTTTTTTDATRTSGYNSAATLYTPTYENRGLPHSVSTSSGYNGANRENKFWRPANVMKEVIFPRKWSSRIKSHQNSWQLCMFVFGGKELTSGHPMYKEPISVWKFYI